jgi:predicted ATP-dependent endonuclease of OLD family
MYLKRLKIINFRKFGKDNNLVEFVDSKQGLQTDNIATATTLIVGKNNSGKTTITKALGKLLGENKFESSDYNFCYLKNLLEEYDANKFKNYPALEFELLIGLDDSDENQDLITNIVPFLNIEDATEKDFLVTMKYELVETTLFVEDVRTIIRDYSEVRIRFSKYLKTIGNAKKQLEFYNSDGEQIAKGKFKLSDLIKVKTIAANKIINDTSLSEVFNKIIQYKYKTESFTEIDKQIDSINEDMTNKVSSSHTQNINDALHTIENQDRLKVRLSSNLDFDILMKQLITYEYIEQGHCIPEGQFGLGYSNLMRIIGEIIEYIEQYPNNELHSKLNLICIEEPETFMHPQMQELFIKNINEAIKYLLGGSGKNINSQLIITTHSSHILNSKIHTSNSFDHINYITISDNYSNVVNLNDDIVINLEKYNEKESETPEEKETRESKKKEALNNLKFIKKHIKHKFSELFFSDAVIFVEGITEETLLTYYLDNDDELNKYYISIFNINGAHGLVYHNLIKLLKIPTLIVTDLDIQRTSEEKEAFDQMTSLEGRITTNKTIAKYNDGNDISSLSSPFEEANLYIAFQSEKEEGYYATSFEEAFILKNYDNDILNSALKKLKKQIYEDIVGQPGIRANLKTNSYKLQRKLSNSKSDFANELLYQLSTKEDGNSDPELPEYIKNAIDWLKKKLKPAKEIQEAES